MFGLGSGGAFIVRASAEAHFPEIRLAQIAYVDVLETCRFGPTTKIIASKLYWVIRVNVPHDPVLSVKVVWIIAVWHGAQLPSEPTRKQGH